MEKVFFFFFFSRKKKMPLKFPGPTTSIIKKLQRTWTCPLWGSDSFAAFMVFSLIKSQIFYKKNPVSTVERGDYCLASKHTLKSKYCIRNMSSYTTKLIITSFAGTFFMYWIVIFMYTYYFFSNIHSLHLDKLYHLMWF